MRQAKKPCPNCGNYDPWRKSTEICRECKSLIRDGNCFRQELKKRINLVPSFLYEAYYLNDTYYHCGGSKEINEARKAIYDLALSISMDDPNNKGDYRKDPFMLGGNSSHTGSPANSVLVDKTALDAIIRLNNAIKKLTKSAYSKGHREGRDLLKQLASGDITINDMNEIATRKEG